jgi:hypothetical protein
MRAQEIIKSVLDLIDQIEGPQEPQSIAVVSAEPEAEIDLDTTDDQIRRFQQIAGLMAKDLNDTSTYANEPDEMYADIDAVTTLAGGGHNGPKHPSDIRGEHPSMYPFLQHRG